MSIPGKKSAARPERKAVRPVRPAKAKCRPVAPTPPPEHVEPVEIVDEFDRPLAVLSLQEAHRQSLRHRAVLVLFYNLENKVYLQRRRLSKRLYPGRWDLSATGHARAGESREDAAIRELWEELDVKVESLVKWREVPAGPDTGYEFVTLFSAGRRSETPRPNPTEVSDGMFVDRDELAWLVAEYRDSLTPGLVYFWEKGLVFPGAEPSSGSSFDATSEKAPQIDFLPLVRPFPRD